jgi:HPt (histidine-containing phosphotransfer) domain-containing protein
MGNELSAIDWSALDASTGWDAALASELLSLYVALAHSSKVHFTSRVSAASADIAHKIKGAASAIGAQEVMDAASRAEAALRRNPADPAGRRKACGLLIAALDRSVLAIKTGRPG